MAKNQVTELVNKVRELELKVKELEEEKYQNFYGRSEMHQLEDKVIKRKTEEIVISFVEAIDKAEQYFDFKEYLKQNINIMPDSDPNCIFNTIIESRVNKERFVKLDDEVIMNAVNANLFEVKDSQEIHSRYEYRKYLTKLEFIKLKSNYKDDIEAIGRHDLFPGLSSQEMRRELMDYKIFLLLSLSSVEDTVAKYRNKIEDDFIRALANLKQEKDEYASTDAIYNMVFLARQAQYVMDQDPEVELEKIKKLHPIIYLFLEVEFEKMIKPDPELPKKDPVSQARTVLLWEVSPQASEDDVRESFSSCGDIEYVEMQSLDTSQIAYVTYKESQAADLALYLRQPKVRNQDVSMAPTTYCRPLPGSADYSEFESEDVKATSGDEPSVEEVEEFVNCMRDKAIQKYSELTTRYSKLQSTDNKAVSGAKPVLESNLDDVTNTPPRGLVIAEAIFNMEKSAEERKAEKNKERAKIRAAKALHWRQAKKACKGQEEALRRRVAEAHKDKEEALRRRVVEARKDKEEALRRRRQTMAHRCKEDDWLRRSDPTLGKLWGGSFVEAFPF